MEKGHGWLSGRRTRLSCRKFLVQSLASTVEGSWMEGGVKDLNQMRLQDVCQSERVTNTKQSLTLIGKRQLTSLLDCHLVVRTIIFGRLRQVRVTWTPGAPAHGGIFFIKIVTTITNFEQKN